MRLPELSPTGHPPTGWALWVLYRPAATQARLYSVNPLFARVRARHG